MAAAQPAPDEPKSESDLALQLEIEKVKLERERLALDNKVALQRVGFESLRPERRIIYFQLAIGASLVLAGGLLVAIFTYTQSVGTAIIGAGAALLPAGAAASANARISASTPTTTPDSAKPADTPPPETTTPEGQSGDVQNPGGE